MSEDAFWDSMSNETRVKVNIVSKYFSFWSKATTGGKNPASSISYIDLFSGRGVYRDGTPSTPIRIISQAIEHGPTAQALHSLFCESDKNTEPILRKSILALPELSRLVTKPIILDQPVGDSIVPQLTNLVRNPTLSFVDPYGYKGVTAKLLSILLSHRRSELILFFNFNRFNPAVSHPTVNSHARAFFGKRANYSISHILKQDSPQAREESLIREVGHLLGDLGARYVQFFRFQQEIGERTSHYLVFATKHEFPLDRMKEIMSAESSEIDGITAFGWMPSINGQLSLPIHGITARQTIKRLILDQFSGRTVTFGEIYRSIGLLSPFSKRDFRSVINEMENLGEVTIDKPREKRIIGGQLTLGESREVSVKGRKS